MATSRIWFICPGCRSRVAVDRQHRGEIRCPNCSALLKAAKQPAAEPSNAHGNTDEQEYQVAPLERPATHTVPAKSTPARPQVELSEAEQERWGNWQTTNPPPDSAERPTLPNMGGLTLDDLEFRDHQRYRPQPPPRWTFLSGVFAYPWRPQSLLPWMVLSGGLSLLMLTSLLVVGSIQGASQPGAVIAGVLGLVWIWLAILVGSYAAACMFAIIETTAYNFDEPHDWPEPDWRERFTHLLWLGWCLALPMMLLVTPASLLGQGPRATALITVIGGVVFLPLVVLSTLETNSLVPVSGPVWRSLVSEIAAWVSYYLVAGLLVGLSCLVTMPALRYLGLLSVLLLGPLWSATLFIVARLMGRLAWRIMQPGEAELRAWRKMQQSTLAGELRPRTPMLEDDAE
jgi:hypothetical protein